MKWWHIGIAMFCSMATIAGMQAGQASKEDEQTLQIVLLRGQLAEALKAQAKCEAEGSKAQQELQKAAVEGQALIKALDAKGLMVDPQTNTIVPKPSAPAPKP